MVQALCECWLVSGGPGLGELAGRELAVGAVGSVQVVVDSPVLDEHLGFEQAGESTGCWTTAMVVCASPMTARTSGGSWPARMRPAPSMVGAHLLGEIADRTGLSCGYSSAVPWTGERAPGQDPAARRTPRPGWRFCSPCPDGSRGTSPFGTPGRRRQCDRHPQTRSPNRCRRVGQHCEHRLSVGVDRSGRDNAIGFHARETRRCAETRRQTRRRTVEDPTCGAIRQNGHDCWP